MVITWKKSSYPVALYRQVQKGLLTMYCTCVIYNIFTLAIVTSSTKIHVTNSHVDLKATYLVHINKAQGKKTYSRLHPTKGMANIMMQYRHYDCRTFHSMTLLALSITKLNKTKDQKEIYAEITKSRLPLKIDTRKLLINLFIKWGFGDFKMAAW